MALAKPKEGARCPSCGKPHTAEMVVGKTTTFLHGTRTIYEVVSCPCGKTFRGSMIAEKKRERR